MATETTNDAVIETGGIPANQQANLNIVTTPEGTVIANTDTVAGLSATVSGQVLVSGGRYESTTFSFTNPSGSSAPGVSVSNTTLTGTTIIGGTTPDAWSQGSIAAGAKSKATTKTTDTNADFGEGADSVSFLKKSLDKGSSYKMGGGEDSVTFGRNTTSKSAKVKLGSNDKAGDTVDISKKADIKKLKITEFGKEDTLKIGGKTFSYDDLQNKDFKNITIKFD